MTIKQSKLGGKYPIWEIYDDNNNYVDFFYRKTADQDGLTEEEALKKLEEWKL